MSEGRYKMGTIAQRTGFSPGLLRAWERRHNLLEPARGQGGHRLYTDDDLYVLRKVKSYLDAGRSIGEIAVLGRPHLLEDKGSISQPQPRLQTLDFPSLVDHENPEDEYSETVEDIVGAAVKVDRARLEEAVERSFSKWSASDAIYEVLLPSARKIGTLWASGDCGVAGEHLATATFVHRVQQLLQASRKWNSGPTQLICSCFPDEQHELGPLIIAYELSQHSILADSLGQSLPLEAIEGACRELKPKGLCLSVTRSPIYMTHKPKLLEFLDRYPDTHFFMGGYGIPVNDPDLIARNVTNWNGQESLKEFAARIAGVLKKVR
ncbi:MAG: MerR family transcriptional regulator [Planctomycetota bacterium]|nr:MerR family transcriptional regulator [Planctomycetota bacterium]